MKRTAAEAARTRATLCAVALRTFAARGYAATTLAEISEAAGLTRGAVYHHFANKSDLYLACVGQHWQQITDDVLPALDGDAPPAARLHGFVAAFSRALGREETRLLLTLTVHPRDLPPDAGMDGKHQAVRDLAARLQQVCAEAAREGQLRDGMTPRLAAEFVIVALTGMVGVLSIAPGPLTFPGRHQQLGWAVVHAVMHVPPDAAASGAAVTAGPGDGPAAR
ncbi:MAG TPA: TetR family transcriptional regulator [Pilimelia sp.]|nr:TetR family transcriptional regulator [Pilimelia sp.]